MKLIITISTALMAMATPVLASGGHETTGTSLLVLLFIGFGALIAVFQLIPSLILFGSMIRGLFDGTVRHGLPKTGAKTV